MVHKAVIAEIAREFLLLEKFDRSKCPYNGFNSVQLMSIRVIESQNAFY